MTVSWTSVDLLSEVQEALLDGGGDVSDDLTSFFTEDANINIWAKYKPVIDPTLFFSKSEWQNNKYRGLDGHCGISIYEFTSYTTLMNRFDSGSYRIDWTYTPPSGGTSEPMRLGDFRGYCSTADSPFGNIDCNGIMDSDGYVQFDLDAVDGSSSTSLTLSDICIGGYDGTPLSEMYLGIYLTNGTRRFLATAEDTVEYSGLSVRIKVATAGDWLYAPFLSTSYQEGLEGDYTSGTFISCGIHLQDITIESSSSGVGYTAYVSEAYWSGTNQITAKIIIENESTSSQAFTGLYLFVYGDDKHSNVLNGAGEVMNGSGTLVTSRAIVNAGDTYESSAIKITVDASKYNYYGIMLSCNTPRFSTDVIDIEDDPTEL